MTGPSWATTPGSRASMLGNRSRDTKPELAILSLVHAHGLRYRVAARPLRDLRRTADIVFRPTKVAVFIDGCFWHGCPEHGTSPKANADYWAPKLERNKARDAETTEALEDAGWLVIRVWEHESPDQAAESIIEAVLARKNQF